MDIFIDGSQLSKRLQAGNAGIYRARVTGYKITTSKAKNPMLNVEFTILSDGPNPAVDVKGKCVYDNFTFTEDSIWKANIFYNALTGQDIPAKRYSPDEFFMMLWNIAQGKELVIEVTDDVYEGTTRPKVTRYQPMK